MKIYETMPASAQKELYDFALFLLSQNEKQTSYQNHLLNRRAGIAKDSNFYMAPDFDEPLEDFAEYM